VPDSTDLKTSGLKATFPRMKILDIFRDSPTRHMSAEDIYKHLLADETEIGLATVYRVLAQFEQAGLVKRTQLGAGKAVYELNDGQRNHGHLISLQTGEVQEFYDPEIEKRLKRIAQQLGYHVAEYTITMYGDKR